MTVEYRDIPLEWGRDGRLDTGKDVVCFTLHLLVVLFDVFGYDPDVLDDLLLDRLDPAQSASCRK